VLERRRRRIRAAPRREFPFRFPRGQLAPVRSRTDTALAAQRERIGRRSPRRNQPSQLDLFDKLAGYANDLGLLAEEIDTANGELLGNFPQAFSHIGLITAAWEIDKARGTT
jgi:hypothetical protein